MDWEIADDNVMQKEYILDDETTSSFCYKMPPMKPHLAHYYYNFLLNDTAWEEKRDGVKVLPRLVKSFSRPGFVVHYEYSGVPNTSEVIGEKMTNNQPIQNK